MKNLKKVLALVLAFACAFTMFAGAAFTDEADINADNRDAVELLTALNIIQGYEDGSFDPEGTVDRAEMAKMIYTIRNGGNDDASAYKTVTTTFQDINGHWAEGYIKYLQNTGIVAGKSATRFDPDAQVTTGEAMKMALALAGYDEKNAGLTGAGWLNNTVSQATTVGMTKNVHSAIADGCSRQDAAQILSNTLTEVGAVRWSSIVEGFVPDSKSGLAYGGNWITVGEKWMDLAVATGYIARGPHSKTNPKTVVFVPTEDWTNDKGETQDAYVPVTFRDSTLDVTDLAGYEVTAVWNTSDINGVHGLYGVYATENNASWNTMWKSVDQDGTKNAVEFDDTSLDFDRNTLTIYKNGYDTTTIKASDFDAHYEDIADLLTFIDNDGDGDVNAVQITNQNVVKITYVGEGSMDTGDLIANYNAAFTSAEVGDDYDVTPDLDDVITYDDIAKDDYAKVTYDYYNDKVVYEKIDKVEAKIEATRTNQGTKEIRIDGTWYKAVDGYTLPSMVTGDTIEYVAIDNLIYFAEKTDGTWGAKNLAVVTDVQAYSAGTRKNNIEVSLMTRDGDKVVAVLDKYNNVDVALNTVGGTVFDNTYDFDDSLNGKIEGTENSKKVTDIRSALVGQLVTYRESGSEVSLMPVGMANRNAEGVYTFNQKAGYDDLYTVAKNGDGLAYVSAGNDVYTNAKNMNANSGVYVNVADTAIVFIWDDKGNADVLSGSELDSANIDNATDAEVSKVALGGEENGADYIQAVAIKVDSVNSVNATGSNYAYVISAAETADGEDYRYFELWTENGFLEAYEESSDYYTYDAGDIVTFEVVSTGERTIIKSVESAMSDVQVGSITSDGFYGSGLNRISIDRSTYDLANDCVVLNVNTDDKNGIEGDDAKVGARQARLDTTTPAPDDRIENVIYIVNGEGDLALVIVDGHNNEIVNKADYGA